MKAQHQMQQICEILLQDGNLLKHVFVFKVPNKDGKEILNLLLTHVLFPRLKYMYSES